MHLEELATTSLLLDSNSAVYFIYRKYKCVFCLDFSSSMLACHSGGGGVPLDLLADSLEICLKGLLTPKDEAQGGLDLQIYISVIAYCEVAGKVWSLLQGYLLHPSTLREAIRHIRREILAAETRFRQKLAKVDAMKSSRGEDRSKTVVEGFPLDPPLSSTDTSWVEQITQKCGLALSFLPSDAAPLIVLLSDCVFKRSSSILYDGIIMQLCRNGTAVHGVQLVPVHDPLPHGMSGDGDGLNLNLNLNHHHLKQHHAKNSNSFNALGYVPDGDAVKHLCTVTGGTFFPSMDNLKHTTSIAPDAEILEQRPPEKRYGRWRSHSTEEPMDLSREHFVSRQYESYHYSIAEIDLGTKNTLFPPLSPRLLFTVFQHCLLSFLSPLSQRSMAILESPCLHAAHTLGMMGGEKKGHRRRSTDVEEVQGIASSHRVTQSNNYSSLLLGDFGRYNDVRHEHVLSYALGRVHLSRLLEIRCSEGFRIVDWSLGQLAGTPHTCMHALIRYFLLFALPYAYSKENACC